MRILAFLLLVFGCTSDPKPTPTGSTCPDVNAPQYSWQNFGYDFTCHYCVNCHDSSLKLNQRNGAPLFHDLDSFIGLMDVQLHTDEQAAWGPKAHNNFMPGGGTDGKCPSTLGGPLDRACPEPTSDEREALGEFIACENQRPQDYSGPDAAMTDHCAAWTASQ